MGWSWDWIIWIISLLNNQWCSVLSTVCLCLVITEILQCEIWAQWEKSSQAAKQGDILSVIAVYTYCSNRVIGLCYLAKTIMQKITWLCEFCQCSYWCYPAFSDHSPTLIFMFYIMALSSICSPMSSPLCHSQLKPTHSCTPSSATVPMVMFSFSSLKSSSPSPLYYLPATLCILPSSLQLQPGKKDKVLLVSKEILGRTIVGLK